MHKMFVLDTNVLLHSAKSISVFHDNDVVIPMAVIEELDKFKKNSDELGRNARAVIRNLDHLRRSGHLYQGVPLNPIFPQCTGKLYVLTAAELGDDMVNGEFKKVFSDDLGDRSPDNRILRVAYVLKQKKNEVVFISKDINLRLKADALGLRVMDLETEKVDTVSLHSGFRMIESTVDAIEQIYHAGKAEVKGNPFFSNEFAVFANQESKKYAICRYKNGELNLLDNALTNRVWNISPKNREQRMALDLLLDPEVQLVTLIGGAGTGKTLLALASALQLVVKQELFERILVSRPIVPLGNDIGFLPGDKNSKLSSWMQPIFDNLDFLLGNDTALNKGKSGGRSPTDALINSHKLDLEALTYIRGRSIPRQFVIIDEAQNLTPHEIKTIISRAGEGTKMVLTGDPQQIDNPYLDASSNGLSYTVDRLKEQAIFGHVTLARSERSELAGIAARYL